MPRPLTANMPEVFAEEKQRELEPGIFRVIAGDDFRFRLRQIERRAVGFGGGAIMNRMNPANPHGVSTYQCGEPAPVTGLRLDDV